MLSSAAALTLLLVYCATLLLITLTSLSSYISCAQQQQQQQSPVADNQRSVESLFGQVAKTVVYGGASFARFNSRLLCPLLSRQETSDNKDDLDEQDQPTLFVFNKRSQKEHAYRIYADDDISRSMIEEAQFDATQMTYIFVHGWLGGIQNELWLSGAKNTALGVLNVGDDNNNNNSSHQMFRPNVIIVDWSEFAQGSLYTATQNSFKVSRRLARLLEQLVQVGGLKPELMHCLGHSIGTHICGQAARYAFPAQPRPAHTDTDTDTDTVLFSSTAAEQQMQRKMGRITGLDPGGFCYELGIRNETTYLGLKPSDALLVDAYYSNRSPFGNRYQVAHYNVRLNNGFFQRPCSVWRNPEVATQYFRAAIRFSLGNIGHNDILTCDHYFATRFAHQMPSSSSALSGAVGSCSYVAYACDSYRDFIRGKCGLCETRQQCYEMDFEYQRGQLANVGHAREHIAKHSSYATTATTTAAPSKQFNGGVPYANRLTYYMRVADVEPYCSRTFRVRLYLNLEVVDVSSFRAEWLRLIFYASNGDRLSVIDANVGSTADSIGLYGPWTRQQRASDDRVDNDDDDDESSSSALRQMFGLEDHTLTALFELVVPTSGKLKPTIDSVQVQYDNQLSRRQDPLANPVDRIQLDYLSSSNKSANNSRLFAREQFKVLYKHLDALSAV